MISPSKPLDIDVLYFADCPNHKPTVELLVQLTSDLGVDADINEIAVRQSDNLEGLRFRGSPTVQINGADVEPDADGQFGFGCRMYGASGVPSRELLVGALAKYSGTKVVSNVPTRPSGFVASLGSMAAAILGTACCWLPPLLLVFGVSAGSLGSMFAAARPWLLTLAFVCLGFGFFAAYRNKKISATCNANCCDTRTSKWGQMHRGMLWVALAFVLIMTFVPSVFTAMFGDGTASVSKDLPIVTMSIAGMDCQACATTLQASLVDLPDVTAASVSYENGIAQINVKERGPQSVAAITDVIERSGFQATLNEMQDQE